MDVSKQQIAFYEELINIQTASREKLKEEELFPKPDKNQALERIKNGLPLISFEGIKIKEGVIKEILDNICNALIKHGLCKEEEIGQLSLPTFHFLLSFNERGMFKFVPKICLF
ncbi:MAG: hypothetical protein ABIF11_11875 [Nitrospirota bacterium]